MAAVASLIARALSPGSMSSEPIARTSQSRPSALMSRTVCSMTSISGPSSSAGRPRLSSESMKRVTCPIPAAVHQPRNVVTDLRRPP
ncbi:hypothetical protein SCALM49S_00548 [Streptomyces californicus]